jgi:tRNA wybutosine-synthesizing protein 3
MVAVRCNGLALDSVVGYMDEHNKPVCIVSEEHLNLLNDIATERFRVNMERIQRFRNALLGAYSSPTHNVDFEDPVARKARKKREGLARQEALRAQRASEEDTVVDTELS